ncbi:MAG TPA: hypothetical protein VHC39_16410 [Rhizomicrobium sp.]|nr:hypothetical protein [Rhizomicrobium sp.]
MRIAWSCVAVVLMLICVPAQARQTLAEGASPVKWKWYYTIFGGASYFPPTVFSGMATITRKGSSLQVEMQLDPKLFDDKTNLPVFHGVIHSDGQVDGVIDGMMTEADPRPVHGNYHSIKTGPCLTETIVLEENMSREDVLVFHRGSPAGCGLVW